MGTSGAFIVFLHGTVLFKESLHAHPWSLLHWFCLLFVVLTIQSCCTILSLQSFELLPGVPIFPSEGMLWTVLWFACATASHHSTPILYQAPEFSCRLDLYSQPPCLHGKLIGWLFCNSHIPSVQQLVISERDEYDTI